MAKKCRKNGTEENEEANGPAFWSKEGKGQKQAPERLEESVTYIE